MNVTMKVWHLNRELALAHKLASIEEHMYPFTDASCGHGPKGAQAAKELWMARCYEPVAVVNTSNCTDVDIALELTFQHTNHIDKPWNKLEVAHHHMCKVTPLHHEKNRSTSVGDIIEVCDGADAKVYLVSAVGFKLLKTASL